MRRLLARHPLLASLALAVTSLVVGAALVLPRLDALEIVEARPDPAGELVVRVAWRLASAPAAELVLRAPAPGRKGDDALARVAVASGRGEAELRLAVPRREAWLVLAELSPAGAGDGLLDRLQQRRRRDLRVVRATR